MIAEMIARTSTENRTVRAVNLSFVGVGGDKVTPPRIINPERSTRKTTTKIITNVVVDQVEVADKVADVDVSPILTTANNVVIDNQKPSDRTNTPGVQYPGLPKFPLQPRESKLGGRLAQYAENWALITQDSWILNTLTHGLQWIFIKRPPLLSLRDPSAAPQTTAEMPALLSKVRELLLMNTIEIVQDTASQGFYSRFFVVPKKAPGGWRAVLDLMALNQYIPAAKFKMETAESIRSGSTSASS
jgi:hypothetical protein